MFTFVFCVVSFTLACLIRFFLQETQKRKYLPPGPPVLPFVGSIPFVALAHPKPHLALVKLAEQYGDVMRVKFASHEYVILSSTKALNELLSKDATIGRPTHGALQDRAEIPNTGIAMAVGDSWRTKRSWMTRTLREMGIGRTSFFEDNTRSMIHKLHSQFRSDINNSSKIVTVDGNLALSAGTMMWRLLTGSDTPQDDADCEVFLHASDKWAQVGNLGEGLLLIAPFLKHFIPKFTGYSDQMNLIHVGNKLAIKLHQKLLRLDKLIPETFFHSYILEEKKGRPGFFETDFKLTFNDIMLAAVDSTNVFIQSLLLFLTRYPVEQEKLYKEITSDFPEDHVFSMADLKQMPYTQSFMLEVHRLTMVVTNWAPRTLIADITYRGFTLKKGTSLLPNPHMAFKSKTDFGPDADAFRPERFIDSANPSKLTDLRKLVTPFSIGKRICPGESIAQVVTFLFLVYTVRNFKMECVPGETPPPEEFIVGIGSKPIPFKVLVSPRLK